MDGDTSTNDTVFVLASGAAGAAGVAAGSAEAEALGRAIEAVARDLARQQAADGEGATTLLTCQVSGAVDDADARAVARAVVSSSLVKAAAHGRDPNWGRIVGAAGNARLADAAVLEAAASRPRRRRGARGAPGAVDPDRLRVAIAGHLVFDGPPAGRRLRSCGARAAMDGARGPRPARPRARRRHRRGLRLRPDRGLRDRERGVHDMSGVVAAPGGGGSSLRPAAGMRSRTEERRSVGALGPRLRANGSRQGQRRRSANRE